eukprot:Blabericola_migrator_1__76@NODE_101_length_14318_cov_135_243281_g28_i1_p12_GENE_NODE_101_length_14318_cov_135_243281_g28_i1NODE_101_length_14318_cov_135_243281_g28_i1_p12_ORF_typecomplete_len115_score22_46Gpatch/PF01585_23/4_3e14Gpatch_2/PF12656_7/6_1e10Gpatch_2/PF12656_7/3_8e03_NODE_101_length_14318_cov_135_243281_g28_i11145111795
MGSSYGEAFLKRFGWKEGEGLGAKKDGIVEPLQVKKRSEHLGLGAEKEKAKEWDSWWEDVYNKHAASAKTLIVNKQDDSSDSSDGEESKAPQESNKQKSVHELTGPELLRLCRT